jgi:hypothetical protein
MKKIISTKENTFLIGIPIIIVIFLIFLVYKSEYISDSSTMIGMYFIILIDYIYLIVKWSIRNIRLKKYNLTKITTYTTWVKLLCYSLLIITHGIYIYSLISGEIPHIIFFLGGMTGFTNQISINQIFVSDKLLIAGNRIIEISSIDFMKDDGGSNIMLFRDQGDISIFCGSASSKKETIKYLCANYDLVYSK